MPYGPVVKFFGAIISGVSTVTSVDLDKSWSRVFVEVSTFSTNAALTVFGSSDGTTFRPVFERVNTAPVQYQTLTVATGVLNGIFPLDVRTRYVQFQASAAVAGGASFTIICSD